MVYRDPKNWRDPRYWGWWWRYGLGAEAKFGLAIGAAVGVVVAGVITADTLSSSKDSQTLTVPVDTLAGAAVSEEPLDQADVTGPAPGTGTVTEVVTVFETVIRPGETNFETVRRNGRTLDVRKGVPGPGETVTYPVKVPGPVRERVVTNERTQTVVRTERAERPTTVTAPGTTETVTREVTQPARVTTVTTPGTTQTVTREVTQPARTVTETNAVTVTQPVTVTQEVTVTETVKGKPPPPPPTQP